MHKTLGLIAAAGMLLTAAEAEACFTVVNGQIVFNGGLTPPGCNGLPNAFPTLIQAQIFASTTQTGIRAFTLITPTTPGGGGSPTGSAGPGTNTTPQESIDSSFGNRVEGRDLADVAIGAIRLDALDRYRASPPVLDLKAKNKAAADRYENLRRSREAGDPELKQAYKEYRRIEDVIDAGFAKSPEGLEADAKVKVVEEAEGIKRDPETGARQPSGPAAKATQQAIDKPVDGPGNSILDDLPEMMGPIS